MKGGVNGWTGELTANFKMKCLFHSLATKRKDNTFVNVFISSVDVRDNQWFEALLIHSTSNTITIVNLSPITAYDIRVKLENEIGFSDYSNAITITTTMEAPSVQPQDVQCVALDSRSIKISWT
ncbi:unnamed protein product, partial [Medioppia subpectinata]